MPANLYTLVMLGVYELNDVGLLKNVFMWGYERSAARYTVVRQSLGEPDPFRLKYRNEIRTTINRIIVGMMNSKMASDFIRVRAVDLSAEDQARFIGAIETELLALHDGNFARYRVSPKEFKSWRDNW